MAASGSPWLVRASWKAASSPSAVRLMSNSTYSAPVSRAFAYTSMVPVRGPCAEMAAIPDLLLMPGSHD